LSAQHRLIDGSYFDHTIATSSIKLRKRAAD